MIQDDIAAARLYLIRNDAKYLENMDEGPTALREAIPTGLVGRDLEQAEHVQQMKSILQGMQDLINFMESKRHFEEVKTDGIPEMVQTILTDVIYLHSQLSYYAEKISHIPVSRDDKLLRAKKLIEAYQILSQFLLRLTFIKEIIITHGDIVTDNASALLQVENARRAADYVNEQLKEYGPVNNRPEDPNWMNTLLDGLNGIQGNIRNLQEILNK